MDTDTDEDRREYRVVVNHEEQYSIWLADREMPPGWTAVGPTAVKKDCLARITELWTDMRPLSLRRAMAADTAAEPDEPASESPAWDPRFEAALRHVVPALAGQAPVTADLDLAAAGLSSVGIGRLMMRLEREYGVEFDFDLLNFRIFRTPSTLWAAIAPSFSGQDVAK
jgi:MbtH protein